MKNAKVYCFASAKGGSGKTIITANIASFLTCIGKKCLMIDCDAATHGMTLLYIENISSHANENKVGLFDYLEHQETPGEIGESIVKVENGVDLLPATYKFSADIDTELKFDRNVLEKIVNSMRPNYDLIFLDAQAGSDKLSRLAMSKNISDEVILVSEYDPLSSAGLERLKQLIGDDLGYARTWTLLNKMLPEFVEKFSEFLSVTKFLPPIPWNAKVVRAYAQRKLALDVDKGNDFTLAIMRTVGTLMGENLENEIKSWANDQTYALREPLEEQYAAAESALDEALKARSQFELRLRNNTLLKVYMVVAVVGVTLTFATQIFTNFDSIFTNFYYIDKLLLIFGPYLGPIFWGVVFLALLPILLWTTSRFLKREKTAESTRHDRVIATLEERLQQLESLRSADYETIVKAPNSFSA